MAKVKHLVGEETRCFKYYLIFLFWFAFEKVLILFGWDDGLREIVVPLVVFIFEHFIYSSAKDILYNR